MSYPCNAASCKPLCPYRAGRGEIGHICCLECEYFGDCYDHQDINRITATPCSYIRDMDKTDLLLALSKVK